MQATCKIFHNPSDNLLRYMVNFCVNCRFLGWKITPQKKVTRGWNWQARGQRTTISQKDQPCESRIEYVNLVTSKAKLVLIFLQFQGRVICHGFNVRQKFNFCILVILKFIKNLTTLLHCLIEKNVHVVINKFYDKQWNLEILFHYANFVVSSW